MGYGLEILYQITEVNLQGLPERVELLEEIKLNGVVEATSKSKAP